jgi:hypothetical protein
MARKFLVWTIVLILLLGLFAQFATPVQAQKRTVPGIDLIVLLDQSGSNSCPSKIENCKPSDPAGRRIYTTRYLMDYLAFDNTYVNSNRTNSVSVIDFDDKANIAVNNISLKDDSNLENAKKSVTDKSAKNGFTNYTLAFEKVREIFPVQADSDITPDGRQRLIVILTDGFPDDTRHLSQSDYFKEIVDAYNRLDLAKNYPVYVIAVDASNYFFPKIEPFWKPLVKDIKQVKSVEEINGYATSTLCKLLNTDPNKDTCPIEKIGYHFIQPYLQTAAFSFFKYTINDEITLKRPNGTFVNVEPKPDSDLTFFKQTKGDNNAALSGSRDQIMVMNQPQAGCWESARKGAGVVDVVKQVIFNKLMITQPKSIHSQALPLKMQFELKDTNGKPIPEDPNFPITITGVLKAEDGTEQAIEVKREVDATGKPLEGSYVSTTIPTIDKPGQYQVILSGKTSVAKINNLKCLPQTEADLKVFQNEYTIPVEAPRIKLIQPADKVLQYAPIENLVIQFIDSGGKDLTIPSDKNWDMEVTAIFPSNKQLKLASPVLENGQFTIKGPLVFSESGEIKIVASLKLKSNGKEIARVETALKTDTNIKVVRPPSNYPAGAPLLNAQVGLYDFQGNAASIDPKYPLRLEAELAWPDPNNKLEILRMEAGEKTGEFRAAAPWNFMDTGKYPFHVRGYLTLATGREELAFDRIVEINATTELPYYKIIIPDPFKLAPENEFSVHLASFPLIKKPIQLRVEVWRGQEAVDPRKTLATDPGKLVSVTVLSSTGVKIVENQPMNLSADGLYLESSIQMPEDPGTYKAIFQFNNQATVVGGAPTEGAWPEISASLVMKDNEILIWIWRVLAGAALIALAALMAQWLLDKVILTKAKGVLIAEGNSTRSEIKSWNLSAHGSHTVVFTRPADLGSTGLKKLIVKGMPKPGIEFGWLVVGAASLIALILMVIIVLVAALGQWTWLLVFIGTLAVAWTGIIVLIKSSVRQTARVHRAATGEPPRVENHIQAEGINTPNAASGLVANSFPNNSLPCTQASLTNEKYRFHM